MAQLITRIVEDQFKDDFGTVLHNVHSRDNCEGQHCVIHNPSDHHMKDWPLLWRFDKRIFERLCPHRVGHPDPDDDWFQVNIMKLSHSCTPECDGCCHGKTDS